MLSSGWAAGLACIVLVALIWNASSVLVQALFTDVGFVRPFFLTWVANSLFMVVLPLRAASLRCRGACGVRTAQLAREAREASADSVEAVGAMLLERDAQQWRLSSTSRAALLVCPIWFTANFTYNLMTSITASTVISSSSAAFTLLLSAIILAEPINILKLLGVVLCWLGNGLTLVVDGEPTGGNSSAAPPHVDPSRQLPLEEYEGPGHMVVGDIICLFSALLYACYTVAIRRVESEMTDLALFFGYLGVFTFLLFGPFGDHDSDGGNSSTPLSLVAVVIFHLSRVETLDAMNGEVMGLLLCKGIFDNVLSDYLWAQAVLLTSPAVATLGLSLTVPMSIVSQAVLPPEWLVVASGPSWNLVAASTCVILGFLFINLASVEDGARIEEKSFCGILREPFLQQRSVPHSPTEMEAQPSGSLVESMPMPSPIQS